MLRLAADENFNNNIVRGLQRRKADLDLVRVQDVGLSGASNPAILEWAAQEDRLLLTHGGIGGKCLWGRSPLSIMMWPKSAALAEIFEQSVPLRMTSIN